METSSHGLLAIKVIAIAVSDLARAQKFYGELLALEAVYVDGKLISFNLGGIVLMLKDDWYGKPTAEPNPRLTIECTDAIATEAFFRSHGVIIADPVATMDEDYLVGSFLDSEGNKLWFCSESS